MFKWLKNIFRKEKTSKNEKILSAIIAFAYVAGLGFAGKSEPGFWYENLVRPELTPPNYVFGIVWPILFVLIAMSGYYVWNYYQTKFKRNLFAVLYAINGGLICLWSQTFFSQHNIIGALYIIIGIIIVAELMILVAFTNKKMASYLLLPYLAWILFATYLNAGLLMLNA